VEVQKLPLLSIFAFFNNCTYNYISLLENDLAFNAKFNGMVRNYGNKTLKIKKILHSVQNDNSRSAVQLKNVALSKAKGLPVSMKI
jgi:hypothetical protein